MPRRSSTLADYQQRILRVQQRLEAQLDEPIDPPGLARHAGFSLHHFHRIFRAQLGESVMQHVRRLRLERAARLLRSSEREILDLALDAGYESHEAFTRAFADRFGAPPSIFRTQPSQRLTTWQPVLDARPPVAVRVEDVAEIPVVFMRARGSYARVHALWAQLMTWSASSGVVGAQYGLCPDDPEVTDEDLLRFDACLAVTPALERSHAAALGDPAVARTVLPAGSYAIGVHVGPYDRLHETYLDIIGRWFPTSGYDLAVDAVIEHYLDDPRFVPPHALRTEVRVRIAD